MMNELNLAFGNVEREPIVKSGFMIKGFTGLEHTVLDCWVSLYLSTRMVYRKVGLACITEGFWSFTAQPNLRLLTRQETQR